MCGNVRRIANESSMRKMHYEIPGNMLTMKSFGAQSFTNSWKQKFRN